MTFNWTSSQVREDWQRARRQALWAAVMDVFGGRPGELLPLEEIRSRLNIRGSRYLGLQEVALDQIVGSEGRYADFDRRFLPRAERTAERWMNVDRAQYEDKNLPPVELYKIGDIYFVKDGNHRISVARQRGMSHIDAYVTEYQVDVPLDASFSLRDLILKEEYSDFLDWTQLARLRPEQRIELSALGGYLDLVNHINTHRYYLARERQEPVPAEVAVTSWYDNVYRPVIEAIRAHNILRYFPGRSEADLYLWIMQHRHFLREQAGEDPGAEAAVLDYAARFGDRSVLRMVGEAAHALANAARAAGRWTQPPGVELLDFVEWSRIGTICPDIEVRLSNPADYQRLRSHIEDHQYFLGTQRNRTVERDEAVRDWCDGLFGPIVEAIRSHQLLEDWPGHTEADLYLEVMDQLHTLRQAGSPAGPVEAVAALGSGKNGAGSRINALMDGARRLLRLRR